MTDSIEFDLIICGSGLAGLRAAIATVGSVWYTAWVDAGQPDLSELQNTPPSAELLDEMKALDVDFHSGQHKGRICE